MSTEAVVPAAVTGGAAEHHAAASARAAGRPPLPRLTALRGLGAILVFVVHAFGELLFRSDGLNETLVWLVAGAGEAAVSMFFVLSGFVLVWVARAGDSKARFWRRRIVKVYPNHVVAWFIGLSAFIVVGREFNVLAMLPSLALVQVWMPKQSVLEGVNGPAWSLACEMFFYALFPFVAVKVAQLRDDRLWKVLGGLFAIVVAWTVLIAVAVPTTPITDKGVEVPVLQFYFMIFVPPLRFLEFLAGMILAQMLIRGRWPQLTALHVGGALLGGYALSLALPAPLGYLTPFLIGVFLLVGHSASADLAGRPSWILDRRIVWMGEISFAFYLVHWIVLRNVRHAFGEGPWAAPAVLGYWALCLAISLAIGHALYRYVEMPMVRRFSSPKKRAKAASAPAAAPAPMPFPATGDPLTALAAETQERAAVVPPPVTSPPPAPSPAFAAGAREAGLDWPPHQGTRAPLSPPTLPGAGGSSAD